MGGEALLRMQPRINDPYRDRGRLLGGNDDVEPNDRGQLVQQSGAVDRRIPRRGAPMGKEVLRRRALGALARACGGRLAASLRETVGDGLDVWMISMFIILLSVRVRTAWNNCSYTNDQMVRPGVSAPGGFQGLRRGFARRSRLSSQRITLAIL